MARNYEEELLEIEAGALDDSDSDEEGVSPDKYKKAIEALGPYVSMMAPEQRDTTQDLALSLGRSVVAGLAGGLPEAIEAGKAGEKYLQEQQTRGFKNDQLRRELMAKFTIEAFKSGLRGEKKTGKSFSQELMKEKYKHLLSAQEKEQEPERRGKIVAAEEAAKKPGQLEKEKRQEEAKIREEGRLPELRSKIISAEEGVRLPVQIAKEKREEEEKIRAEGRQPELRSKVISAEEQARLPGQLAKEKREEEEKIRAEGRQPELKAKILKAEEEVKDPIWYKHQDYELKLKRDFEKFKADLESGSSGGSLKSFKESQQAINSFYDGVGMKKLQTKANSVGLVRILANKAAQDKSAMSGLGLIFGILKYFDPESAAREGEQALVQRTASLPSRIFNYYDQLKSGNPLNRDQIADIYQTVNSAWSVESEVYRKIREDYVSAIPIGQDGRPIINPNRVARPEDLVPKNELSDELKKDIDSLTTGRDWFGKMDNWFIKGMKDIYTGVKNLANTGSLTPRGDVPPPKTPGGKAPEPQSNMAPTEQEKDFINKYLESLGAER